MGDAERRLYVLTRLVAIAFEEMPERLNNATRVNITAAHRYAEGRTSTGTTRDLEAAFDRLDGGAEAEARFLKPINP